MNFFDICKAYFSPEERIRRHLIKVQNIAEKMANYTILKDVLLSAIKTFVRGCERDENFTDWHGTPVNDNDIKGMYECLILSASKSGWDSNKLHYIERLYSKAIKAERWLRDLK